MKLCPVVDRPHLRCLPFLLFKRLFFVAFETFAVKNRIVASQVWRLPPYHQTRTKAFSKLRVLCVSVVQFFLTGFLSDPIVETCRIRSSTG